MSHSFPAIVAPTQGTIPPADLPLVMTGEQVCAALQIDSVTLWRLEKRGLIRRVPYIRHRRYATDEVRRFISQKAAA